MPMIEGARPSRTFLESIRCALLAGINLTFVFAVLMEEVMADGRAAACRNKLLARRKA